MSAGVAHADPSFVVAESQARAGDVVHFTITGADGKLTYDIEVDDRDVLKGSGKGVIAGQFTMPDFGSKAKNVTVEADMRDEDGDEEDKRALQYLGQALPVVDTPAPQVAAPAAPQQAPAAPSAPAVKSPSAPASTDGKPSKAKRRHAKRKRSRSTTQAEQQSDTPTPKSTGGAKSHATRKAKPKHRSRPEPRRAPLFNGVPEADTGGHSAADGKKVEKHRAKPPTAVVTNAVANRDGPGEPATAILIPGVLGLLGFILAGATLLRQRRNN